jgi:phage protein D
MRPAFVISAGGQDLTEALASRLASLTLIDEKGIVSDSAELIINDPESVLAPPRKGVSLEIAMGYGNDVQSMGAYVVETVTLQGPPDQYIINAKATDFLGAMKVRQRRGWQDVSIAQLVTAIAGEHDLTPAVDPAFESPVYAQIDQTESDLNLLTRLARDHGAIAKPVDGHLVFTAKGEAQSVTGKAMPAVAITEAQIIRWSLQAAERSQYAGVTARWFDLNQALEFLVRAGGQDGPQMALPRLYEDEARAKQAAAAKWDAIGQARANLELTVPGQVSIQAETPLALQHRRDEVAGDWIVTRAEHRIDTSGFTTRLNAERPKTG